MTSNEKNAWVSLLTALLVLTPYYYQVFVAIGLGSLNSQTIFGMLIWVIVGSIIVSIVLSIVLGFRSKENFTDERDRNIIMRSNLFSYWILTLGIALLALELIGLPDWFPFSLPTLSGIAIAQIMFAVCTISNLAKDISRIVYYRRGV